MLVVAAALALTAATPVAPPLSVTVQAPPATDIWLATLDLATSPPSLTGVRRLTDHDGYDNQPAFEPEGTGLLFTSRRDGQAEVYRVRLDTSVIERLTDTPEEEYSPTVMPGGRELSVVRVEGDGTQRLWAFRRDGSAPRLLLRDVAPVGYQAWRANATLVLFILGEPATLQRAELSSDGAAVVATDIGRSLQPLPDGSGFSFLQRVDGTWRVRSFDPDSGDLGDLGTPFEDSQDLVWTPDGRLMMAAGSRVAIRTVDGDWRVVADLEDDGVRGITRLAVHPDGDRIALVAAR